MMKPKNFKILKFPTNATEPERQVEAILFAAEEPLDIESIKIEKSHLTEGLPPRGRRKTGGDGAASGWPDTVREKPLWLSRHHLKSRVMDRAQWKMRYDGGVCCHFPCFRNHPQSSAPRCGCRRARSAMARLRSWCGI